VSILYDAPGPRTRRRHAIGGVVGGLVVAAFLALIVWKLNKEGQFSDAYWAPFQNSGVWQNTLLPGLRYTVQAAALAILLAVAFGMLLCAARLSDHLAVRVPGVIIIEFFRACPLLLMILFFYLAFGKQLGTLWPLVLGLMVYNGSVLAETFRAGINAVPRGEVEAGYSVGLVKSQVTRTILLPQAIRAMLPAIISQCVVALKDTSLGFIISYEELVRRGKGIYESYYDIIPTGLVLAAMFITMNYTLSRVATYIEARLRRRGQHTVRPTVGESTIEETG
jgi:glutamate transport system permease protein